MKKTLTYILFITTLLSCSVTRYIPDDEQLYTGIKKIKIVDAKEYAVTESGKTAIEEVKSALACQPNGALAGSSRFRGIPIGLWWYNAFHKSTGKIGKWFFNTFATTPVLLSDVKPELRTDVANEVLKYYGYFNGKVKADTIINKRNPKKVKIEYTITLNEPYTISSVSYLDFPLKAYNLVDSTKQERLIRHGEQFDATKMEHERTRLNNLFRNNGYYYFQPQYITFLADTIGKEGFAELRVQPISKISKQTFKIWKLGKINIHVKENGVVESGKMRKFPLGDVVYTYNSKKRPVAPGALRRNILLHKNHTYSALKQKETLERLNQMNIFSNINISLLPSKENNILDVNILAELDKPYDFTFELNATSKNNGQIGPGSKISLARKNLFRSSETLQFSLNGSYEWQTNKDIKGNASVINSWEIGADISLAFPRLFLPIVRREKLSTPSTTSFRLYGDLMNRSGFFRMVGLGGDATYKIFSSSTMTHTVTPFSLTYDMLLNTTERFDSIVASNPSIENSFRNQFIPAIQYTYLYNNAKTSHRNKTWLELSVTSAGNVTSLLFVAFGKKFNEKDKNILGNPYAQFVKGTAEIRQLWKIDNNQYIATRIMTGAIFTYGNSNYAPYSEQFYIGGANSLRAFTIRSIGPGSYHPENRNRYSYLDETGTLKLEMNAEYRFRIISDIHGALFVDAGNIWLIKENPERPGGEIRAKTFAKQIALNTGFGIRYDNERLVLRADFGLGLHAPYDTGRKGYFNLSPFKDGFAWHFTIGYPF